MGTELLSRLPRHHPCSISNALVVSTELLSRFEDTFSIQSASLFLYVLSSSQGPIFLLWYLCNDPLRCSQGLQETFSALCIVILQASIPAMICPSHHFKEGLSKAFFHHPNILHTGSAREGFSKCSSSSSIFQTRYQKPTDMHSPSPSI